MPNVGITPPSEARMHELYGTLHHAHREVVDFEETNLKSRTEINKQIISFYERLMLLDLGTLALSVNVLIALSPKFSIVTHRHSVLWLVITSWLFLLISTFLCRAAMTESINENVKLAERYEVTSSHYATNAINVALTQLTALIGEGVAVPRSEDSPNVLANAITEVNTFSQRIAEAVKNPPKLRTNVPWVRDTRRLAVVFMQLGLILLAVAAIKFLIWLS